VSATVERITLFENSEKVEEESGVQKDITVKQAE
jgi:hypothetical protein